MRDTTFETLIWVLIYGGLLLLSLGTFIRRQAEVFGGGLIAIGAAAAVVGVVLILVRARRGKAD